MNVSRRQFGASLAGLFGGLFFFRRASASTVSPAAEKFNEHRHETLIPRTGPYLMRGTVADEPTFKVFVAEVGRGPGCRLFFRMKTGDFEPTACMAWGQLAHDLHHKMRIKEGTKLVVRGEPVDNGRFVYITLTDAEKINGSTI